MMHKYVCESDQPLLQEERNLLSVAYKNVVGARRSSLKAIANIPGRKEEKGAIRKELKENCEEIISLLDTQVLTGNRYDQDDLKDAVVFFRKMKGDYYRYIAEMYDDDDDESKANKEEFSNKAEQAYNDATELVVSLDKSHPVVLGLMLNFSVFYFEIKKDSDKACELAKTAFDDALGVLDSSDTETYKDSALILQLLRDNLTLWKSDKDNNETEDQ
jgi:hypothetical protein